MTATIMAIVLQTSVLAADSSALKTVSYEEAIAKVDRIGKPLVVMVSTDWCHPCQTMKKEVLPSVNERGLLKRVVFSIVNPDRDTKLAEKLIGSGPIPQLLMFRKTSNGWVRKKLIGSQSVETVEEFINNGLASGNDQSDVSTDESEKVDPPGLEDAEGNT